MKNRTWPLVAVCFLIMALQYAPGVTLVGLFLGPLQAQFAAGRTAVTGVVTVGILASMAGSLFGGRLLTRFGFLRVMLPAFALSAACNFLNSAAQSLPQLYLLAAVRGVCGTVLTVIPISVILNQRVDAKARGKAVGIAMMGSGAGAVVLSPLTQSVIQQFGWRAAYRLFGVFCLALIPLVALTFGGKAESKTVQRAAGQTGIPAAQAVGMPMFWAAALGFVCLAGVGQSWNNNAVSFLQGAGLTAAGAAGLFAASTASLTLGKVVLGAAYDKWGGRTGTLLGAAVLLCGVALLLLCGALPVLALPAALVLGFGMAVVNIGVPLATADLFGQRDYATLVGYLQIGVSLGAGALPLAFSALYDATGAYSLTWLAAAGVCLLAGLFVATAYRRRPVPIQE